MRTDVIFFYKEMMWIHDNPPTKGVASGDGRGQVVTRDDYDLFLVTGRFVESLKQIRGNLVSLSRREKEKAGYEANMP